MSLLSPNSSVTALKVKVQVLLQLYYNC